MADEAVQNLPIDIQFSKLRDWLIDRQWVKKDYFKAAGAIRRQINSNWNALPEEVRQGFEAPEQLTYYDCQTVIDRLKETEHGAKNMLGQYTSPIMKTWASILADFEQDYVFLGDSAAILAHDVNFEIPAARKAKDRAFKRLQDLNTKETEFKNASETNRKRFVAACKDLGFEAVDAIGLEGKIQGVQHKLEPVFDAIVAEIKADAFQSATDFYNKFMAFTLGEEPSDMLPLLTYIAEHGNTAVHTFKTGEAVEVDNGYAHTAVDVVGASSSEPVIDFGDEPEPTIDFGDSGPDPVIDFGDTPIPTIDFGDTPAPTIDFGDGDGDGDGAPTIDFGEDEQPTIDFGEQGAEPVIDFGDDAGIGIVVEGSGAGDGDGDGDGDGGVKVRESLLHHRSTRLAVVDELEELMMFFTRRSDELGGDLEMAAIGLFDSAHKSVQNQSKEQMGAFMSAVTRVHTQLTGERVQQLLMIKSSSRYVQRLADELRQKLELADRALRKTEDFDRQRAECRTIVHNSSEQTDKYRQRIRTLKKHVEQSISKLYSNRPVHIVGDINAI
ncbi:hypothetical protein PTSG_03295 [Salpingoeca rosetta]|uniref:CDK5RAP3-like protein n=1 Tax=Salpingoeca rosetta (strain ATCC 50818 / BSB-021) TaxID=946362 RepID=F2U4S2_SALR5|nr:uncharacterized protein PTSG_03295 [Salpingoeca rosetta]EGD82638.1 hypothetical protein PTSG_03295 [Salpingoeca rosetta]|eukprot:XP_004995874.1 hypothetical protein PTSG_03295 [Salpingoeca rosetta]